MNLRVQKNVRWNGQDFIGYEIVGIEWIFRSDTFNVLTDYLFNVKGKDIRRLYKHQFNVGNDVNVDEVINMVHKLHQ